MAKSRSPLGPQAIISLSPSTEEKVRRKLISMQSEKSLWLGAMASPSQLRLPQELAKKHLQHPLSEDLVARYGWSCCAPDRSTDELAGLKKWAGIRLSTAPVRSEDLRLLNFELGGGGSIRHGQVALRGKNDEQILLCSSSEASNGLEKLFCWAPDANPVAQFLRAVRELVLINNLHPFTDGNGRTSRALFNFRLWQLFGAGGYYVPLKELYWMAEGGYEIRLRLAEIAGNWDEIVGFMLNCIRVARLTSLRQCREPMVVD